MKHGVIHYAVANIPGAVPHTSTFALTNVTIPFALELANHGMDAVRRSIPLQKGVNTHAGKLTCEPVALATGLPFTPLEKWLESIPFDHLQN